MANRLISAVKVTFASVALLVNILYSFAIFLPVAVVKLLLPFKGARKACDWLLNKIAENWIAGNVAWMRIVQPKPWKVTVNGRVRPDGWYLVSSNHQSWVDILVLQRVFNRRIPLLKFFIKHELIYIPIMGLCWWALDFPFMRRKGGATAAQDLATARKSCEKFRAIPTSVISFPEGTRFTQSKHDQQQSPYRNLLKPKTGGLAMALQTMGDMFDSLLDITIVYPGGAPSFTDLMAGRVADVIVVAREVPIPPHLKVVEDAATPAYRAELQAWVHEMWARKDAELSELSARFHEEQRLAA